MAEPERGTLQPVCLLLIFGIPASGKTLLTNSILSHVSEHQRHDWSWVAIHFDDFYPPDTRSKTDHVFGEPFDLKEARRELRCGLETLLARNLQEGITVAHRECTTAQPCDTKLQIKTTKLLRYINSQTTLFDDTGRLRCSGSQQPIVFVLDDNMPLRSMRYEYYKMARKHKISFAEVCLKCALPVALARNSLRATPIPTSTIVAMEESLELPDPALHRWEERCHILDSDAEGKEFMVKASDSILKLVRESLTSPVPPVQEIDSALQEASRVANLKSCIHLADNILRKCVSSAIQGLPKTEVKESKAEVAKRANLSRKEVLREVQSGVVAYGGKRWEVSGLDYEQLQDLVEKTFGVHLQK